MKRSRARHGAFPHLAPKTGRMHHVPLSQAVRDLLAGMDRIKVLRGSNTTNGRTPVSGFSKARGRLAARMVEIATQRANRSKYRIGRSTICGERLRPVWRGSGFPCGSLRRS